MTNIEQERAELFEFASARSNLNALDHTWATEVTRTKVRRQMRTIEVDVETMRSTGKLDADETFLPVRTVDDNIRKEQAAYVAFISQANHLVSMTDKVNPSQDTTNLQNEFSKGMKYVGWDLPWYAEFDGAQLHGWDAVEVLLDTTKPLNVCLEHVGHDKLFFAQDLLDIQDAPRVCRVYTLTPVQIRKFVRAGQFDAKQAELVIEGITRNQHNTATATLYKSYFKWEGLVFVCWYELQHTTDWLSSPKPFYNGVRRQIMQTVMQEQMAVDAMGMPSVVQVPVQQPSWQNVQEELYPIFLLRYQLSENHVIIDVKGRAFFDAQKQEAQTAILTAFVNGLTRASNIYAAPKNPTGSGILKYQSDLSVQGGKVFNEPVDFFNPPYPDAPSILSALQYLDAKNANEIGALTDQLRRKKGEKTATEYEVAQQDTAMLSSVSMTLLSAHVREVYSYAWRIVQSQGLQGLIPLLVVQAQPLQDGTESWINDNETIGRVYDIRAAGDVEVVQKAQRLNRMMQSWPVIQATPLAQQFLIDMVKAMFPENATKYEEILKQGDPKALLQPMAQMLSEMIKKYPQELTSLPPEQQQMLNNLLAQANAQPS